MQGEGKALLRCINYHVSLVCIFALGVRVILAHFAVLIQNYWSCGQEIVFFLCMLCICLYSILTLISVRLFMLFCFCFSI